MFRRDMLLPVERKRLRDQGRDGYYGQHGVQCDSSIKRAAVEAIGSKALRRDLDTRSLRGLEPGSSGSRTTCKRAKSPAVAVAIAVAATARPAAALLCLLLRICRPGFLLPHEATRNYSHIKVSFGNKNFDNNPDVSSLRCQPSSCCQPRTGGWAWSAGCHHRR